MVNYLQREYHSRFSQRNLILGILNKSTQQVVKKYYSIEGIKLNFADKCMVIFKSLRGQEYLHWGAIDLAIQGWACRGS